MDGFFSSLSLYESGKNKSVKRHLICYLQKNRYTYIQYMTSQLFQMFLLVPSLHHKLIYLKVTKNRVLRQMPTVNFVVFFFYSQNVRISDSIIVTLVKSKTVQHFRTKNKNEQHVKTSATRRMGGKNWKVQSNKQIKKRKRKNKEHRADRWWSLKKIQVHRASISL